MTEGLTIFDSEYSKKLVLSAAEAAGLQIAFDKPSIEKMAEILKERGILLVKASGETTPLRVDRCLEHGESNLVYIHKHKE